MSEWHEIARVPDWPHDTHALPCLRACGQPVRLHFNGGELDRRVCCGLEYATEHVRIDLVISDTEDPAP